MELPVIIAIVAVIAVILFASGFFKGGKKQQSSHSSSSHSEATGTPTAAGTGASSAAASSSAAAGEKEKKGKKKNRSNKTKAQKAKARALAVAIAAAQSASEAERTETEPEPQEEESESDSDSSDDEVLSGVRFQVQAKLQADQRKAQKAAMLAKEKQLNAPRPAKSALKQVEVPPVPEKPHGSDGDNDDDDDDNVETPVTKITNAAHFDGWAVVEDKRKAKTKKAESDEPASSPTSSTSVTAAAPSPVPAEAAAPAAAAAPPAPVVETVTTELKVDAKKIGLLIGPKGATKIQIQTLTGATIVMPKADKDSTEPVTISVTGPALGVSKAVTALNELCSKGYATLLEAEDFQESYVAVHPDYLPDIIGKAGASIRALQQHTGVRITIPTNPKGPGPDGKVIKTKIGLAGRKEKVSQARALIKDLCKYYHTPVTHPGLVHQELELDGKYFNFIIGAKGSEIKNIQNTHKVQVHIPDADSVNPNLVIVGSEAGVESARKHIEKIVARVDGAAEAAALAAEGATAALASSSLTSSLIAEASASPTTTTKEAASGSVSPKPASTTSTTSSAPMSSGAGGWASKSRIPTAPKPVEEVPEANAEDAWMNEFAPPTGGMNLNAMLPATAKFAPQPLLPAATTVPAAAPLPSPVEAPKKAPGATPSAWNNLSSLPAEKW